MVTAAKAIENSPSCAGVMNQRASTTLVANWIANEVYCETSAQAAAVRTDMACGGLS
ncbi:hypothetical protein NUTIK01_16070 [Novosphingobium sp. IK01]|uniref:Uncharacterized protein n=1 Tax=Novosphingobium pituita TaxID=3056842 RepID=A0ABQ6P7H9_9SPHN|nr:hypothetical protein NUTIK01_16070 [Novosphingobium sp. IK01]